MQLRDLRTLAADAGLRSGGSKSVIISRLWRALLEEGRAAGSHLPPWCGLCLHLLRGTRVRRLLGAARRGPSRRLPPACPGATRGF